MKSPPPLVIGTTAEINQFISSLFKYHEITPRTLHKSRSDLHSNSRKIPMKISAFFWPSGVICKPIKGGSLSCLSIQPAASIKPKARSISCWLKSGAFIIVCVVYQPKCAALHQAPHHIPISRVAGGESVDTEKNPCAPAHHALDTGLFQLPDIRASSLSSTSVSFHHS